MTIILSCTPLSGAIILLHACTFWYNDFIRKQYVVISPG